MVREYTWQLDVRSYETDAWGIVPTSGILRYLEQSAVAAAADAGYGAQFHLEHNSAWVVRRMTLLMHQPVRQRDKLEITTWISNFARVRGGREYRICNAADGLLLCSALAEWVYLHRETLKPLQIPPVLAQEFDVPGAPLGNYDPPLDLDVEDVGARHASPLQADRLFITERTAEWHEADSMAHVNNANYADWLDDAFRAAVGEAGWSVEALRQTGLHLRGEYYNLNYKRAALPGDKLRITTQLDGVAGRLCVVHQSVTDTSGEEMLAASSIYGWRSDGGEPVDPPQAIFTG